jgi:hypothetical protein
MKDATFMVKIKVSGETDYSQKLSHRDYFED